MARLTADRLRAEFLHPAMGSETRKLLEHAARVVQAAEAVIYEVKQDRSSVKLATALAIGKLDAELEGTDADR